MLTLKLIKTIILLILLGCLLFFQIYWVVVMSGGLFMGLGLMAWFVFACHVCAGGILLYPSSARTRLISSLGWYVVAGSLWMIGTSTGGISNSYSGRIEPAAYGILLFGFVLGASMMITLRLMSKSLQ